MRLSAPIKPPPPPKLKRHKSFTLRFLGFLFATGGILFLAGSAAAAYVLWHVSRELPDYDALANYQPPVMTRIHANDGRLIAEYAKERRIYVPINAVPKLVINAFLAAEDKNFFKHGGLDLQGIMRAILVNIENYRNNSRRLVGASTITQQVAKNFLLSSDQTFTRKMKEAILAIRIERAFTKEQILELYLNEIYLGLGAYGIAAAALNYYGKSLAELELAEAAYLAALPKAPKNYHPFRQTKRALARRNWVLGQMAENGFVSAEETKSAKALSLNVNPRPFGTHIFAADFFAEEVRRYLQRSFGTEKLYGGGLSVRTTLNPKLQRMARKALINGLVRYDKRHGWRGVTQKIALTGDWGKAISEIDILSDLQPWRLAVVLEATEKVAKIGLRPVKLRSGKLEDTRETGIIPYEEVKWAHPYVSTNRRGKKPKVVTDVLAPGDVIYVAPREIKPDKKNKKKGKPSEPQIAKGEWSLMQIPEVEGAIVAMDPHTGRVHALVGGFSFAESQFDRATQAKRQPGSAFKPIVYATALDNGYTPASVVLDAPISIDQGPGKEPWKPKNYGGKFNGPSTLRLGIEKSRNLMTVRLAQDMGMPLISEYARRFGVYDDLSPVLSMSLGAGETTLIRITAAYSMLANSGKTVRPTLIDRIQDRFGKTILRHDRRECPTCAARAWENQSEPVLADDREQVVDPHTAYQITSMLEGVVQRGTGYRIKAVKKPLAGKTGTTNEEKDAWFIGFSPDLAVGVFIGYDTPT
ncbi:MAG: penicillin-binding protein 1A, partial [Methyloligellaceae bacterium]